ncbi:unnamed protein product [Rotaria sp. Silwood1]|nr:unnamed protein product [Rotaria sp. Silwood1]
MISNDQESIQIQGEDISPSKDGCLLKEILREGTGDDMPLHDDRVSIHFIAKRLDGSIFNNTREHDRMYTFSLGQEEVIKAWDIGVATMKRGEIARFISKPKYAYGQKGYSDKIGPNVTVAFEIELVEFSGKDLSPNHDGSITRRILKRGEGHIKPNEDAKVELKLKGTHNGRIFDERIVNFIAGEGCVHDIPHGVELCAYKMATGEQSRVYLKSEAVECLAKYNIPPDATVEYDLTLIRVERAKDTKPQTDEEKLAESEILKERGDALLKGGHYEVATRKYKKIYEYLVSAIFNHESDRERCKYLKIASQSNLALCYMKMGNYDDAKRVCNRALDFDDKNEKCIFRRGQCHLAMRFYDRAIQDFETVLKINPLNLAAKQQIVTCQKEIKAYEVKEKELYKTIFKKAAETNSGKKVRNK